MAKVELSGSSVRIRLSRVEKVCGLRGDVTFGLDQITGVALVRNPVSAVRGFRAPGLGVPFLLLVGRWRHRNGADLNLVRRNQPAVSIDLAEHEFTRVLVGSDAAAELVERLRKV